jgi:protein-disulfide isomerase
LDYHRAAYTAAVGAECAAAQEWFEEFRAHLFANQTRLDSASVGLLGVESGIPDTVAFSHCLREGRPNSAVDRDRVLAQELAVPGTPGILVNGYLLRVSPDSIRIASLVDSMVRELP